MSSSNHIPKSLYVCFTTNRRDPNQIPREVQAVRWIRRARISTLPFGDLLWLHLRERDPRGWPRMAAGGRPRAQTSASRGRPAVGGLPPSRDLEVTLGMTTGNAWRTTAGGLEDTIVHCGRRGDGREEPHRRSKRLRCGWPVLRAWGGGKRVLHIHVMCQKESKIHFQCKNVTECDF